MDFWFCPNDIEHCMKGTKHSWVLDWPQVLDVWPILSGTNLTCQEALLLQDASFKLPRTSINVTSTYVHIVHPFWGTYLWSPWPAKSRHLSYNSEQQVHSAEYKRPDGWALQQVGEYSQHQKNGSWYHCSSFPWSWSHNLAWVQSWTQQEGLPNYYQPFFQVHLSWFPKHGYGVNWKTRIVCQLQAPLLHLLLLLQDELWRWQVHLFSKLYLQWGKAARCTSPNHHSKFLKYLAKVWYLNTYSLSSCFIVADNLAIAKSMHKDLQTMHEI